MQELESDVKEECNGYGQVLHIHVEEDSLVSACVLYMKKKWRVSLVNI